MISLLNLQFTEKEVITQLTSKDTNEEDSQQKSSEDKKLSSKLSL